VIVRVFGKILPTVVGDTFALIGGFWFAAMLYFILFAVFFDLARFIGNAFSLFPSVIITHFTMVKLISFLLAVAVTTSLLTYGYFNAMNPKITKLEININKQVDGMKKLHLVFASDIHLGHVIGKKSIENIITKINSLDPDIVLFPGDVVDEELYPVVNKKLGDAFTKLNPTHGVYAVTGNHEYIGGVENAVAYLGQHGIKVLRDEVVNINDQFYVAGREDISINGFINGRRKSLKELVNEVDNGLPIILMDHQPIKLTEAVENEIDLQVSGHTHHGQMWPLNFITENISYIILSNRIIDGNFYVFF
jgi:predicted MPP superfamily phosphohydrolase